MARRRIANARCLVTGASSGIGRAIARELARQGARLIVTARRRDRLESLAAELAEAGTEMHLVAGDITAPSLREMLFASVESHFGGLDVLINNAGLGAVGEFESAAPDRLRQIMEVNFFAPVETIRLLLPLLRHGDHPLIANVSSVLGHRAVPTKSEYCASKFALHGFSDSLRAELVPDGIDVCLISPSTTESEFFDQVLGDRDLPQGRFGKSSAASVAKQAVNAIRLGKQETILTLGGKALVWLDRLAPPLANWLLRSRRDESKPDA